MLLRWGKVFGHITYLYGPSSVFYPADPTLFSHLLREGLFLYCLFLPILVGNFPTFNKAAYFSLQRDVRGASDSAELEGAAAPTVLLRLHLVSTQSGAWKCQLLLQPKPKALGPHRASIITIKLIKISPQ